MSTIPVVRLGHGGDGVTVDGRFVPYTLPGDSVRFSADGWVTEILPNAPGRVAPVCRHFARCGGCALQHMERAAYLAFKRDLVRGALAARGFADPPVADIRAVFPGTRRRATLKAEARDGAVALGFYEAGSRRLVDIAECPLLVPALAQLIAPLRAALGRLMRRGTHADIHLTALAGVDCALMLGRARTADFLGALVAFAAELKLARLAWNGDVIVVNEMPVLRVGDFAVALPVAPFLQPTAEGECILQDLVCASVGTGSRVADLFAGLGTLALALAPGRTVHAVESDEEQLAALSAAARAGGARLTAERRDLYRRPLAPEELVRFDAVVLDPPRPGAKAQVEALAAARTPRIVYVSCNAATFARDAQILTQGGYGLEFVVPLDQFLWSAHIELVAQFGRSG